MMMMRHRSKRKAEVLVFVAAAALIYIGAIADNSAQQLLVMECN